MGGWLVEQFLYITFLHHLPSKFGFTHARSDAPLRTWLLFTTPKRRKEHQDSGLACWISIPRWQSPRSKFYP